MRNLQPILQELEIYNNEEPVGVSLLVQNNIKLKAYIDFIKKFEFYQNINLRSDKLDKVLKVQEELLDKIINLEKAYENILYYLELLKEELS